MTNFLFTAYEAKATRDTLNARKMREALEQMRQEYADLGQREHATLISVSLLSLDDADLAKLHRLVMQHDTKAEASASLDR